MASLTKNIGYSIITFSAQFFSGSIVYIVFARKMSVTDFGLLSFGISLGGILMVMADFGFSVIVQKYIPQNKFPLNEFIFNNLIQKVIISLIVIFLSLLYLLVFYDKNNVVIGLIFLFNAIITAKITFFLAVFRSKNKYNIETQSSILYSIFILFLLIYYLLTDCSIFLVAWSLLFSRIIQLVVLLINYYFSFGVDELNYNKSIQAYLLKVSYSYGLQYIIGIFYFSIDTQLIVYYIGNEALAIYLSFFRIVLLMLLFNELMSNVFLPYLSSYYSNTKNSFVEFAKTVHLAIILISLSMFVFLNLFSSYLMSIIYNDKYSSSTVITFPLSLVLLFRITATFYAICLTISGRQRVRLLVVIITLTISLIFNFIFIPLYGIEGAAFANLITHSVLLVLYFIFAYKEFGSTLIEIKIIYQCIFAIVFMFVKYIANIELKFPISILIMTIWILTTLYLVDLKKIKNLFTNQIQL